MLIYSSDASGNLTAEAPGTIAPPQIVGQPVDQLVSGGDFASFSVVVANTSGVKFQWAFNGTDIADASGDSLLLPAVSAANVGQYSVTVTNSAGSVTSSAATLALDSGSTHTMVWKTLDQNPVTKSVTAGGNRLYQLHDDGKIWQFIGQPLTGWVLIDQNPATKAITAAGNNLYRLQSDGKIWRYTEHFPPATGWQLLYDNPATNAITAARKQSLSAA
jgi:Immunoglobulin I-set domain